MIYKAVPSYPDPNLQNASRFFIGLGKLNMLSVNICFLSVKSYRNSYLLLLFEGIQSSTVLILYLIAINNWFIRLTDLSG